MTYIRAIKHLKMNSKKEPCGSGSGYNFVRCLKNSITRTVGCRLEWDRVSSDETPLYQKLGNMEQKELVEAAGCALPCEYMEYQQQGLPYEHGDTFGLGIIFATTEVMLQQEILVYPLLSFIAECGGALGLFLGFSLNMLGHFSIWIFKAVLNKCFNKKK